MKKGRGAKWISLFLILAMTVSLFAACGKKNEDSKNESNHNNSQTEQKTPEEGNQVEGEEGDTPEDSGDKEFFPLEEKTEFSLWTVDNGMMTPSYEATDTAALVEEATNVHLKVAWVTANEAQEKFGLMIASGDIPDMVYSGVNSYYTGGPIQAVKDGLFLEMTDLIDQYMPNYKAILDSNEQLKKDVTADDGKRYSLYSIYMDDNMNLDTNLNFIGMAVRKDWLDEAGLEMPVTIEDWTEALTAFKDRGVEAPLMIGNNGRVQCGAFLSAYGVLEGFYMDGDTVKFGPAEPGYKEYLTQMKEWYNAGLLDQNFTANNAYALTDLENIGGDKTGMCSIWWQFGGTTVKGMGYPVADDYFLAYAPNPVLNETDPVRGASQPSMVSAQLCVNSNVTGERLETLCRYLDYHYTKESMYYHFYGEENVHYTVGDDGKASYSEMMTGDPELNVHEMRIAHLSNWVGALATGVDYAAHEAGTDECLDMQSAWDADYSLIYPPFATMTGEETEEFNTIYTSITTLVDEMSSKCILGVESLDKYDDYVAQLYQYGLQTCIDLKQAAYDRYQNR